jgi:hypothetical protein
MTYALDTLCATDDEAALLDEPRIVQKIREAKDPDAVIRQIEGGGDKAKDFVCLDLMVHGAQAHEDGA